ncbi:unnamed protein product [Somion occarium]|uniref:Heterokaryon incompatibility protein n=1 Tax=Somion occarium TaxID=3059160 RepID=A0ABP1D4P5_9APHY
MFPLGSDLSPAIGAQSDLRWAWKEVVEDYTQRAVTKPADKLLALAGITEQSYRIWGGKYLAGLWEATLLEDLLWFKDYETIFPRPAKYRAPSWSWASVEGRIIAYTTGDSRLDSRFVDDIRTCDVVQCHVDLARDELPLGRVTAGILRIRCVMMKTGWLPDIEKPELFLNRPISVEGPFTSPNPVTFERVVIADAYPDSVEASTIEDVWAVPLRWSRKSRYAVGLLLTPTENGVVDSYRRVGYFATNEGFEVGWFDDDDSPCLNFEREVVII